MIMENPESILEELEKFEKKTGDGASKTLEDYIHHIAKTGDTIFPWHRIRHFMQHMLETVMNEFYETCGSGEDMSENSNVPAFSFFTTRDKLLHHFNTFTGAPFTIQRLCEIMVDPTRHYRRTDKFLRGLEKNVLVVSSIEPGSRQRRTEDPQHTLINGLQEGGLHTATATSPLAASPIPSLPHHPKRLSLTQSTNSVLNNTNDAYNAEMNDSENQQLTVSEANGPSGLHREDQAMEDSPSDPSEPPSKKMRLQEEEEDEEEEEESFEDRVVEHPTEELPEAKGITCSRQEEVEAEAMEVEDRLGKEGEAEAKMETEEAEAAGIPIEEGEKSLPMSEGEQEPQEASSNPVTVADTPEAAMEEESPQKEEREEEEAQEEEVLPSEASPEVGSSNNHPAAAAASPSKGDEAEKVLVVFSTSSSSSRTCEEGSPDSGEGPEEGVVDGQETPDVDKERESSSEAAAAADEEDMDRSKSPSSPEYPQQVEESSRNSHEADSTSQAHGSASSSAENQAADAVDAVTRAEAEVDSAVPSPPPSAEVSHSTEPAAAAAAVPQESPSPSNSSSVYSTSDSAATPAAHTTSESPSPSTATTTTTNSIITTTSTTTATTNHSTNGVSESPDSETPEPASASGQTRDADADTDAESASAAATSTTSGGSGGSPQAAPSEGARQEGAAAQSCDKRTLASISCSSTRPSEPDHQPTEEE